MTTHIAVRRQRFAHEKFVERRLRRIVGAHHRAWRKAAQEAGVIVRNRKKFIVALWKRYVNVALQQKAILHGAAVKRRRHMKRIRRASLLHWQRATRRCSRVRARLDNALAAFALSIEEVSVPFSGGDDDDTARTTMADYAECGALTLPVTRSAAYFAALRSREFARSAPPGAAVVALHAAVRAYTPERPKRRRCSRLAPLDVLATRVAGGARCAQHFYAWLDAAWVQRRRRHLRVHRR